MLDTTEVFYGPNRRWITLTAKLPVAIYGLRSVTVNNRVFVIGKKIFEWNRNFPVWNFVLIFYILWHRRNFTVNITVKCAVPYFLGGYIREDTYRKSKYKKIRTYVSSKQILVYDPQNKTWQHEINMADRLGRWQHAVSVLPDISSFCGN